MIANINDESMSAKRSIYIDLRDYNSVAIIILTAMNNVLFIRIKVNTFFVNLSMTYRIVLKETVIKILLDLITKTITLMMTIINLS